MLADGKLQVPLDAIFLAQGALQQQVGRYTLSLAQLVTVAQRIFSPLVAHRRQRRRQVHLLYLVIDIGHFLVQN